MSYSVFANDAVPYELRHADAALLVADKPAGVVTQPGKGHERDSLLNGLFARYGAALQNLGEDRGWGLLHRLDRDTSGLVLVALRIRAYEHLLEQFKARRVKKVYFAIVRGVPRTRQGVIQLPIAEVVGSRKRAVIRRDGQQAITAYRVIDAAEHVALIEAMPKTGRLHQIRLHMAHVGHPVLGDDTYGIADPRRPPARTGSRAPDARRPAGRPVRRPAEPTVARLCLHAAALSFVHPELCHRMTVTSPLPSDFAAACKRLGLNPAAASAGKSKPS